jgi:drug/metabolite transporter (DMT)-like permease
MDLKISSDALGEKMFKNKKVLAAYLTVCILWGSTYLAIRVGVQTFIPEVMGAIRFIIIGILLLLIVKAKNMNMKASPREVLKIGLSGMVLLFLANLLLMIGEKEVDSGIASIIVATVPLFIALMEFIVNRENRLTGKAYLGLLVGFAGVFYLVYSSSETLNINLKTFFILILASILWSGGTLYSKNIKAGCSTMYMAAIQNFSAGICFTVMALLRGSFKSISFNLPAVAALGHLIFCGVVAYSSYLYIMKEMPAAKAGTYAYVNPVIAILLGFLILGETINIQIIFSMIIILLGVYMVQSSTLKSFKEKERAVEIRQSGNSKIKKNKNI